MEEPVVNLFACAKNLHSGARVVCPSTEFFELGPSQSCKRLNPKCRTDFKKNQEYGRIVDDYMVRHFILMMSGNVSDIRSAIESGRLPSAPRLSTSLTREPAKKYLYYLEKVASKAKATKKKGPYAASAVSAASLVMKLHNKKTKGIPSSQKRDDSANENIIATTELDTTPTREQASGNGNISITSNTTGSTCGLCQKLESQLAVAYQELESLRVKNDLLEIEKGHLVETVTDLRKDKEEAHDMIKALSNDVKHIKNSLKSPRKGKRPCEGIGSMRAALQTDSDVEVDTDEIYCGHGIKIKKDKLYEVECVPKLQSKVNVLAQLFWHQEVHLYALHPSGNQKPILDPTIEAMKNILNALAESEEVTKQQVREKLKHTTQYAREKYAKSQGVSNVSRGDKNQSSRKRKEMEDVQTGEKHPKSKKSKNSKNEEAFEEEFQEMDEPEEFKDQKETQSEEVLEHGSELGQEKKKRKKDKKHKHKKAAEGRETWMSVDMFASQQSVENNVGQTDEDDFTQFSQEM